jgi:hypothetical protein
MRDDMNYVHGRSVRMGRVVHFEAIGSGCNSLMSKHIGKVVQVIGPVVDVRFEAGKDLPNIYDALHITRADGSILVLETQQLTGEDTVRAMSMDSTDGLARGA